VSAAGLTSAIHAATSASKAVDYGAGLAGGKSTLLRTFGTLAGVVYRLDQSEVARRRAQGVGSFTQIEVLDALMGLPVGLPISWHELTDAERALVDRAPGGAIERRGGQVVRRAVAPVSVLFAVVAANDWRVGLRRAGQFAPFCVRAMLLPALPADWEDARTQASYFGIGACTFVDAQLRMLVTPRPYVRKRHTPAQWWFAEEAYRQISEYGNGAKPARSVKARGEALPKL
jgi:hypothetical protein